MPAKKGNKNALKHGLYARHYTEAEQLLLNGIPSLEALDEIDMLRSTLDHILVRIEECEDEDRRVRLYNSLFTGTQRLLTAMRTHTILVGDNQELLTTFWDAIELFRKDRGIE